MPLTHEQENVIGLGVTACLNTLKLLVEEHAGQPEATGALLNVAAIIIMADLSTDEGLVVGLGLPVTFVAPQQWQKFHHVGPSPDAAKRAMQLYPQLTLKLALKKDHHRADALLIGAYGLQQLVNRGHGYAEIPRGDVLDGLRVAHRRD